ncbi:DUF2169 domain-containing protein [Thalassomonas viridans]|uniref:DUF2169 domain-containing protein n=1 Tax=Thalassomonas viridans TaxID=137584 RepID=A0AAE9Z0C6_9GAMM|nr:DUF2169 domain-containing protein [Thalassomonas viridans]WDE02882.1 DUF2169 domain-containing protein [Thalassomonas viridans]
MLQLVNHTPFASQLLITTNPEGEDIAVLCIKATFTLLPEIMPADEQLPVILSDEFLADPQTSSLLYASECLPAKPGQDIVVNGTAWSPTGREEPQFDCGITLGEFSKNIRIFGDRHWHKGKITTPIPINSMALTYENAYGGYHHFLPDLPLSPQSALYYPHNPIGKGFCGRRKGNELQGMPLPNLENPQDLITDSQKPMLPWNLGYIPGHWSPRKEYSGTYDLHWQQQRSPLLPLDFNRKFFFSGAYGCNLPPASVSGGEKVELINLAQQNIIAFTLPKCELTIQVNFNGEVSRVEPALETLLFEPDHNRFCFLWKTEINCHKNPLLLNEVNISLLKCRHIAGLS